MVATKDIQQLNEIIQRPTIFKPIKENRNGVLLKGLWQTIRAWEGDFRFWAQEYQALKKIATIHNPRKKGAAKRLGDPFRHFEKTMECQFPNHQKSLRSLCMSLRIMNADPSITLADILDQMNTLERRFRAFRKERNRLKLEFLNSLHKTIPLSIF